MDNKCACGKEFYVSYKQIKRGRGKFCNIKCKYRYSIRPSGLKYKLKVINPTWFKKNKGYWVDERGYRKTRNNGKAIREHRLIMENFLNRKLGRNEIVHHKNGDKEDNRIINLEVMSKLRHDNLHKGIGKKALTV